MGKPTSAFNMASIGTVYKQHKGTPGVRQRNIFLGCSLEGLAETKGGGVWEEKPSGVRPTRKAGGCLPLMGPQCPQIDPRSVHRMQGEVVSAKSLPLPGPGPAPQPRVKAPGSPDSL